MAEIWPAIAGMKSVFITVPEVMWNSIGWSTGAASAFTVAIPCSG